MYKWEKVRHTERSTNIYTLLLLSRSVVSDPVRPHRRQPTRLPRPWDPPGKNTGVGCHFLLQCMKVKTESEVAQSCPTLCDPMDCSPPGSSVHGIVQARVLGWGAVAFSNIYTTMCNTDSSSAQCSVMTFRSGMGEEGGAGGKKYMYTCS